MNIYEAISHVMADIGTIGKTSKNQTQGFMYRGIDAVMNALNPSLIKNKVFVVPEVLEQTREERRNNKNTNLIYSIIKVKYHFYAEDGTEVTATVIGEGMDSGDKATNKALSIAFKYACFQVFCIPTEEMVDADAESHEIVAKTQAQEVLFDVITPEQKAQLLHEINRTRVDINEVCHRYKVVSIDDLSQLNFERAYKLLKSMKDA